MLKPFAEDIWLAEGATTAVGGFVYPTRSVVIRLSGGDLFVWSPVRLNADLRAEVEALGQVRHLIAPNAMHHLFVNDWRQAFPGAALHAAPGLRRKRRDLEVNNELGAAAPADWEGQIDQVLVGGNLITTEVVFFHRPSRTAIFTDLIQHFSPTWFSGWRRLVARLDLMTADAPEVPRKFRTAFIDRPRARAALRRILAWPSERVVMAHADPVEADGQAFIARAFRWLRV